MNTRAIQRLLFRMQLDAGFAAAVARGDPAALAGLDGRERALVRGADLAAVSADLGGLRRAQVVGNAGSEFVLTLVEAERRGVGLDVLAAFPRSEPFHGAIAGEKPLPLAFGAWLSGRVAAFGGVLCALLHLERAMVEARRGLREATPPGKGAIALGPRARLVELPRGAFDHAQALRAAIDAGTPPPGPSQALEVASSAWMNGGLPDVAEMPETVLLVVSAEAERHGLRSAAVERLEADVATLLRAAETALDAGGVRALCARSGWDPDDVAAAVADFVADGVLVRGD